LLSPLEPVVEQWEPCLPQRCSHHASGSKVSPGSGQHACPGQHGGRLYNFTVCLVIVHNCGKLTLHYRMKALQGISVDLVRDWDHPSLSPFPSYNIGMLVLTSINAHLSWVTISSPMCTFVFFVCTCMISDGQRFTSIVCIWWRQYQVLEKHVSPWVVSNDSRIIRWVSRLGIWSNNNHWLLPKSMVCLGIYYPSVQ